MILLNISYKFIVAPREFTFTHTFISSTATSKHGLIGFRAERHKPLIHRLRHAITSLSLEYPHLGQVRILGALLFIEFELQRGHVKEEPLGLTLTTGIPSFSVISLIAFTMPLKVDWYILCLSSLSLTLLIIFSGVFLGKSSIITPYFLLTTPDASFLQTFLHSPEHVVLFTSASLRRLLLSAYEWVIMWRYVMDPRWNPIVAKYGDAAILLALAGDGHPVDFTGPERLGPPTGPWFSRVFSIKSSQAMKEEECSE